jgi:hypothetical protein
VAPGTEYCSWIRCDVPQGGFGRGLTNADVVNDEAAAATVAVQGIVNGQPFLVERTVRR